MAITTGPVDPRQQLPQTPFIQALLAQADWGERPAPTEQERPQPVNHTEPDVAGRTGGPVADSGKSVQFPNMTMAAQPQMQYPLDPNRAPLEEAIRQEQSQYGRMSQPQHLTLKQRLMGALHGAAIGAPQVAANERQQAQLQTQERENLANRIVAQQTALSQEGVTEAGQNLRAKLAEQGQIAAAQRLGETLASRERQTGQQVGGRLTQEQMRESSQAGLQAQKLQQQYNEFQNTDQFRRWKDIQDNDTKMRVAQLTKMAAPAAMLQTAEFASGGIQSFDKAESIMNQLEQKQVMGSLPANWVESWLFGNGMVDPNLDPETRNQIGQLRASLSLGASAMLRAHTGRTSMEIYNDFKNMLGPGQDWNALRGAIEQSQSVLGQYYEGASNASIARMRSGASLQPQRNQPQQIPDGTRGSWKGKPVIRQGGRWVLAQQ